MLNNSFRLENKAKVKKGMLLVNANTQMNSVVFCHFSKKKKKKEGGRRPQQKPTR